MTRLERQVRFVLRAWPVPDRAERGDEIVGTTLDSIPPGRQRLPLALGADLVLAGLRARWRAHPPLSVWWRYAWSGDLPPRWHPWMLNDVFSRGWSGRLYGRFFTAFSATSAIVWWPVHAFGSGAPSLRDLLSVLSAPLLYYAVGTAFGQFKWGKAQRARLLAQNGYDEFGRADPLADQKLAYERSHQGRGWSKRLAALEAAGNLGADLIRAGRLQEAIPILSETFARAKRIAPHKNWPTWLTGYGLAVALGRKGRLYEAIIIGKEVLPAQQRLLGPNHYETLKTALNLGTHLWQAGRVAEAVGLLADTFTRAKRQSPSPDAPTWAVGYQLALALASAGRVDEAVTVGTEVLANLRRELSPDHVSTLSTASTLGKHLQEAGRTGEAVDLLADTFERLKTVADDNGLRTRTGRELARALTKAGRAQEAMDVIGEVQADEK